MKKFSQMSYMRKKKEEAKKAKAAKVRIDLDNLHKELGGLFEKKTTFYCMPNKTGKTTKAKKSFKDPNKPSDRLFISVDAMKNYSFELDKDKLTIGRTVEISKLSIVNKYGLVIIDDVHFLDKQRIIRILNEFLSGQKTADLICFGTNATDGGRPIPGARHLESVADKVIYDTSACHDCMQIGKTSFTKLVHVRPSQHPSDCFVDEDDGYYAERDLCFGCRGYNGD